MKNGIIYIALVFFFLLFYGCSRSLSFMQMNKPERVLQQGTWLSYSTRHFEFYFRPASKSSRMIDSIALKQERNYSEVLRLFNLYDYGYKALYFIFESFQDYDDVTGAGEFSNTYEIGNYGSIYAIDNDSLSNVTGKHEITHFVVDNYFGFGAPGPFKWLVSEGMAVWSEDNWKGMDLFEFAGRKLLKNEISSPYFIVSHPEALKIQQNVYPMAGAFTKYMIETYGLEKYLNLYQRGYYLESFRLIIGKSFYQVNNEFLEFLIRRVSQTTRKSLPLTSKPLKTAP